MHHSNRRAAYLLYAMVLIASVCLFVAAYSKSNPKKRYPHIEFGETTIVRPSKFIQRAPLPKMPTKYMVFKVQPPKSKRLLMQRIFRALPMKSTPEIKAEIDRIGRLREPPTLLMGESFDVEIGEWRVNIWQNGSFDVMKRQVHSFRKEDSAPTEVQARKAADKIMECIRPLLIEEVQFSGVIPSRWMDRKVKCRRVFYVPKIKKMPSVGGVSVEVVPRGEVGDISIGLLKYIADGEVPIISPQEALKKLRAGESSPCGADWPNTAYIDSVKLTYGGAARAFNITYIMPVYVFGGEAVAPGKKTVKWSAAVEAVRPEYLEPKQHEPAD